MGYRVRDIGLSLMLLVAFSGVFLLVCLLLWLTQERIFFIQERTGFQKRPFTMIKFSTLRDILPGELEEDDQRIRLTPVGKVLRRLSLDELPQLWNVLRGEMSLVGPRPFLHEYLELYSETQKQRFHVRPGITGWAQVNGRNTISFSERIDLDLWYIEHRSFRLDLKILRRSVGHVLFGYGVYTDGKTTSKKFDGKN